MARAAADFTATHATYDARTADRGLSMSLA